MSRALLPGVVWAHLVLHAAGQDNFSLPANGTAGCPCADESYYPPHSVGGYSQDYGIGCQAHDIGTPPCTGRNPPLWCNQSWCFVKWGCSLRYSVGKEGLFPDRILSYPTCGFLNDAAALHVGDALRNKTIKAVLLHTVGGWQGTYYVEGKTVGPTATFWMKIFDAAGVKLDVLTQFSPDTPPFVGNGVPFPPQVMRQFRQDYPTSQSSFTACAYMTGMGFADICLGDFSITKERRAISSMLTVKQLEVFLVTLSSQESIATDFMTTVVSAFQVFDYKLWIVIGCVTAGMSLLMAWHEHFNFEGTESGGFGHLPWKAKVEISLYTGFASLLSGGGNGFEATNRASRMVSLGLSAFILLVCAAYTANLASALVVKNTQNVAALSGINDAVQQGYLICCSEAHVPILVSAFGVPRDQIAVVLGPVLISGLFSGDCDASMVDEGTWGAAMAAPATAAGDNCQLTKVGNGPLFQLDAGAPVSERVFHTLDVHVTNFTAFGVWKTILDDALPTDKCAGILDGSSSSGTNALTVREFLGPLLLTLLFVVLGFVLQFSDCLCLVVRRNAHKVPGKLGKALVQKLPPTRPSLGEAAEADGQAKALVRAEVEASLQKVLEAIQQSEAEARERDAEARERAALSSKGLAMVLELLERRSSQGDDSVERSTPSPAPTAASASLEQDDSQKPLAGAPWAAPEDSGPVFVPKLRGRSPLRAGTGRREQIMAV